MTLRIYTHPDCLAHDTGVEHVETPERLHVVLQALRSGCPQADWEQAPLAPREALLRVHAPELVAAVLDRDIDAIHWLDADTALSPGSALATRRAAGAALAATDWVLQGRDRRAFCAVRPPGHHATADTPMGFCLFNSIAVAAAHAMAVGGMKRIAIADFDAHHGNGTQAIFLRDPRVLFASSQQLPLYPDSGYAEETGIGNTVNAPLPPLSGSAQFRTTWQRQLLPRIDDFRPELLFISAGFDGHREDPLAHLLLQADDFAWVTAELVAIARRHAQGRVVSTLEGGYALDVLGSCALAHVTALDNPYSEF